MEIGHIRPPRGSLSPGRRKSILEENKLSEERSPIFRIVFLLLWIPVVLIPTLQIFVDMLFYTGIALIPFLIIIYLFVIFWVVQEGTRWQKHPDLGVFARFIQKSNRRSFFVFLFLTFIMIPSVLFVMQGYWLDRQILGIPIPNTTPVVNALLVIFLLLAMMLPIMWGSFRRWRQAVRAEAEVRVRTTQ
ncbi:MAG: hypothetical protein EAX95_14435 [Candidatus Thorarchaeota archaeon]|nr:hypothetical protein [Candidatus Thorarchaeota archaeon]